MAAPINSELEEIIEMEESEQLNEKDAAHTCNGSCLHKRVCKRFVPVSNSSTSNLKPETYCCCGRKMAYHSYVAQQRGLIAPKVNWQVEVDTELEETDACGKYPVPSNNGKDFVRYARLDYATDMEVLRQFFSSEWNMPPVHFVVTLIGSTSPVYLRKKMRSAVQRSLLRLIETCDHLGGWLLAGGAGITQQVSAALEDQLQLEQKALHLIAIQPWGTLRYDVRKALVDNTDRAGIGSIHEKDQAEREQNDDWKDMTDSRSASEFEAEMIENSRTVGRRGTSPNALDDAQDGSDFTDGLSAEQLRRTSAFIPSGSNNTANNRPVSLAVMNNRSSQRVSVTSMGATSSKVKFAGAMAKRLWFDKTEASRLHELPANHPYVLLVDSGQLGAASFASENGFRQRLEADLSHAALPNFSATDRLIPACYVLFAGGPRSTRQVQYALNRYIPVVVLQGTGKMADILAIACSKADEEELDPEFVRQNGLPDRLRVYFRQVIKERVEVPDEAALSSILSDVEKCMAYHHLIFVYPIDAGRTDLDAHVLRAMLAVRERPRLQPVNFKLQRHQNTVDVEPEACYNEMLPVAVDELLCSALLHNHVDCVRLILERTALRLHEFLTVDRISELYIPENLKAVTFKSLLCDRRIREAHWLSGTTHTDGIIEEQSHGTMLSIDAAVDSVDAEADFLPHQLRTPRSMSLEDMNDLEPPHRKSTAGTGNRLYVSGKKGHHGICPLTLAGKVITSMLGASFHSSYLHYGHHLRKQPCAVIAPGQFKPMDDTNAARQDGPNAAPSEDDIYGDLPAQFAEIRVNREEVDGMEARLTEETIVPRSVELEGSSTMTPRRYRHEAALRSSLYCTGDHTEVLNVSLRRRRKGRKSDATDNDAADAEQRVISRRFQFIKTEECAALHLFIWCVLQMRIELAMLFWHRTGHKMATAFVARLVLRGLLKAEKSVETQERIRLECDKFERLALGVLNLAYDTDFRHTAYLLLARLDDVAQMSTIQLAARADCKIFIAHPACTNLLDDVWCGRLSPRTSWSSIIVCIVLPVLIPFLIVFRTRMSVQKALHKEVSKFGFTPLSQNFAASNFPRSLEERQHNAHHGDMFFTFYKRIKSSRRAKPTDRADAARSSKKLKAHEHSSGCCEPCVDCCSKIGLAFEYVLAFYTTPKTIFAVNTMFYIIFLILFSYTMLFSFTPAIESFTTAEWAVFICMGSLAAEEMRQLLVDENGSLQSRLAAYFSSGWNRFDLACLTFFYLGFGIASAPRVWCSMCAEAGRILVTISLMILYLRLLNIFSVNQVLGPKLVMLGQMIKSVIVVFVMIAVFVVAYGVAAQSIMYPNVGQHDVLSVIGNATLRGYFAMFGDLGLEDIENAAPCENLVSWTSPLSVLLDINNKSVVDANAGITPTYCTNQLAKYTVPVLLAIHVIMTNLVLFNVLIATFNYIFTQIDDLTDEHWRYNMYHLIEEYRAKPPLAPPFILIWHLLLLILAALEKLPCCRVLNRFACYRGFRRMLTVPPFCCEVIPRDICEELSRFEDTIASRYHQDLDEAKRAETEARLSQVDNAVKDLSTRLAAVHDVVIATDYNTELIKRDVPQTSGSASVSVVTAESVRSRGDLQKLVNDAIEVRLRPVEDKLNLILTKLMELKRNQ